MNDAGLDVFEGILRAIFVAMMVGPICYFVYYHDRVRPRPVGMTSGKWRLWYTLYGSVALLVLLTSAAGAVNYSGGHPLLSVQRTLFYK